ncbi:MAG: paraquat-inducible protein A [Planctomycetota bacterium]|nr:paraquat-inducible protein A [Planctomycetota bacterium]MDG1984945.1 paraquat-inducible protein A [Planctomycetota bacterium]
MIGTAWLLASALGMGIALTQPTIWYQTLGYPEEVYSILGGISALWQDGTPLLSVVVFAFSIALPLFKLCVAGATLMHGTTRPRGAAILRRLHDAGKWSTLDFWVVGLFVCAVQFGVTRSETRGGIHLFMLAMVAGILATRTLARALPGARRPPRQRPRAGPPALGRAVHLAATLSLMASTSLLMIRLSKTSLLSNDFSLFTATWQRLTGGELWLAGGLGVFVILIPMARAAASGLGHWSRRGPSERLLRLERGLRRWTMTDVLGLALVIVVSKLEDLVTVDFAPGGFALIAAALLLHVDAHLLHARRARTRPREFCP